MASELGVDRVVERVDVRKLLAGDRDGRNPASSRPLEAVGILAGRDHDDDLGGQSPVDV